MCQDLNIQGKNKYEQIPLLVLKKYYSGSGLVFKIVPESSATPILMPADCTFFFLFSFCFKSFIHDNNVRVIKGITISMSIYWYTVALVGGCYGVSCPRPSPGPSPCPSPGPCPCKSSCPRPGSSPCPCPIDQENPSKSKFGTAWRVSTHPLITTEDRCVTEGGSLALVSVLWEDGLALVPMTSISRPWPLFRPLSWDNSKGWGKGKGWKSWLLSWRARGVWVWVCMVWIV